MQQKFLSVIALLGFAFNVHSAPQACNQVLCASAIKAGKICADEIVVKSDCGGCHMIRARDFMDPLGRMTKTVVIDQPGTWCLCEDVVFAPVDPGTPAIQILSNDVYLDLKENTLRQANDAVAATYGILIGEGYNYQNPNAVLQHIAVKNGSITHFTGAGILSYNASFDGAPDEGFNNIPFDSLIFTSLNILDCGSSPSDFFASALLLDSAADGSLYDFSVPVSFSNVIIDVCKMNRALGNSALQVYTGDNVVINNSQFNDLISVESTFFGDDYGPAAVTLVCRNLQINNCQANGTRNQDVTTLNASTGSFITDCINVTIRNSQFNDNFGESDFIVSNAFFSNTQNALIENCQFNNVRGGQLTTLINSIHMSDAPFQQTQASGIKFINCQFNGSTRLTEGESSVGRLAIISGPLCLTLRNVEFVDCQVANCGSDNRNYDSFGYYVGTVPQDPIPEFSNVQNITFLNCASTDIYSANSCAGILLPVSNINRVGQQAALINTLVDNCIIERIHSNSSTAKIGGVLEGLRDREFAQPYPALYNMFIKNCRVSDVRSNEAAPSSLSAGIFVESVLRPVLKNNSVSDCDRGVLFTGSELIYPDNLFQLSETFTGATAFTPVPVDLTSIPGPLPLQSFDNLFESNGITISPSTDSIDLDRNYIYAPVDLNTLGWQSGSEIHYDANGGTPIGGLVDGQIYYLIVYVPGYSRDGVVMNNTVDNCDVSGYQDDAPTTSSAWVNNFAFNNGSPASENANYEIVWSGAAPVYSGDLTAYPTGSAKAYNVSLIP